MKKPIADLVLHPDAGLVPDMRPDEWSAFLADVRERGIVEPVVVSGRVVLDGRHRYRAAKEIGLRELPAREVDLTGAAARDFVLRAAVLRRHLTDGQRAMLSAMYAKAHPKKRGPKEGGVSPPTGWGNSKHKQPPAQLEAAAIFNATAKATEKADAVLSADPQLAEKVRTGEVPLQQAVSAVRHEAARVKAEKQAKATPTRAVVHHGDGLAWLRSLPAAGADLLLTDPPYMTDVPDVAAFAAEWVPLALSRVKPTGRAYICTGAYPEELHAYLSTLLACDGWMVGNVLVWTYRNTLGPSPKLDYKANWQAVFHVRGPAAEPLDCPIMTEQFSVQDINAPDGRQGNRYHEWQKPDELAERIIRHATKEGDTVIDPFVGTGTFILAAARFGRKASGAESDAGMVKLAVKRGCVRAG